MSLGQIDEIGSHALWALVDRWHADEQAGTATLHDAAGGLGVEAHALPALVVVAGVPHLYAVHDTRDEPDGPDAPPPDNPSGLNGPSAA